MPDESYKEIAMKISREVILDLLPLYTEGEASAETCALVEEYLKRDAELRGRVELDGVKSLAAARTSRSTLPDGLELRSLRRTRGLLRWQRRLYGWALAFSIASCSGVGYIQHGRPVFHFFLSDYPRLFVPCVSLAVNCWITYFVIRWRLRSTKL
jgi:hypothetical protein